MRQFDDAFEGVCSLCDMEMAVKPLTDDEIKKNMKDLKKKLAVLLQISANFRLSCDLI
jgi:hypothetical protein